MSASPEPPRARSAEPTAGVRDIPEALALCSTEKRRTLGQGRIMTRRVWEGPARCGKQRSAAPVSAAASAELEMNDEPVAGRVIK